MNPEDIGLERDYNNWKKSINNVGQQCIVPNIKPFKTKRMMTQF